MFYNAKSRRQFLTGTGKVVLGLPVLPSLMPRSVWGAPVRTPLRLVIANTYYGQSIKYFWPQYQSQDLPLLDTGVKGAKLTDLPGPISKVLGPTFNDLKSKMNVIHGTSVLHAFFDHQSTVATGSSAFAGVVNAPNGSKSIDRTPATHQPSIQYILANSPKVYPDGNAGVVKYIGVSRHYAGSGLDFDAEDFSFDPQGKHMGVLKDAKSLYQKLASSFNPNVVNTSANDPVTQSRVKLVEDVYQDYKSVVASGQLSVADRPRFESYMTLIAEVERGLSTPLKSCSDPKPVLAPEGGGSSPANLDDPMNGYVAGDRDCAKILAAALACQLTNVVDLLIVPHGIIHGYQHDNVEDKHSDYMACYARTVAYLWTLMDGLKDADGRSVLDNSFAISFNGDGSCGLAPGIGNQGAHGMHNIPVVTAGSAGGRLRTGYFLDYALGLPQNAGYFRKALVDTGRPYNNVLITIFKAFGLTPSEYETVPGQGYGQYVKWRCDMIPAELTTPAARNQPLPFLWKG